MTVKDGITTFVAIFIIGILVGIITNVGVAFVGTAIAYVVWWQYCLAKDYLQNGDNGATRRRTKESNEYFRKYGEYTFLDGKDEDEDKGKRKRK